MPIGVGEVLPVEGVVVPAHAFGKEAGGPMSRHAVGGDPLRLAARADAGAEELAALGPAVGGAVAGVEVARGAVEDVNALLEIHRLEEENPVGLCTAYLLLHPQLVGNAFVRNGQDFVEGAGRAALRQLQIGPKARLGERVPSEESGKLIASVFLQREQRVTQPAAQR